MLVRITQQHNEDRLNGTLNHLSRGAGVPRLRVYALPMPATINDPPTTPLAAEFTLADPAGVVTSGALQVTLPNNAVILVDGDIGWARFINGNDDASMDVDVSDEAGDGAIKFEQVTGLLAGSLLRVLSAQIG